MRLPVLTTSLLIGALLLAAAPVGANEPAPSAGASDAEREMRVVAWDPGQLDVDMADLVRQQEGDLPSGSFASASDDAARDQARLHLHDQYRTATGAGGGSDAEFNDFQPQRSGAIAQQYYDECDDGTNLPNNGLQANRTLLFRGGADGFFSPTYNPFNPDAPGVNDPPPLIDLRSIFITQTTDDDGRFDQTGFLMYACQPWGDTDLGAGGVTFGLYVSFEDGEGDYPTVLGDPEAGPDFIVTFFRETEVPGEPMRVAAFRTPSRDASTWTLTFVDFAQRLDDYEIDGVIPTSAIGDITADSGFAWTVEVTDDQRPSNGRDWFPERNYLLANTDADPIVGTHVPQFPVPEECGIQTEGSIRYRMKTQAVTPNDDVYPAQWYHRDINTPEAWDTIRNSSEGGRPRPVTVAVVDTGIDATRYDFLVDEVRVVGGLDAVYGLELEGGTNSGAIGPIIGGTALPYETFATTSQGPIPRNSDRGPHGTAVASLIGARGNNTIGMAGVDWGVRLMPIRVNDVNNCIDNVTVAEGVKWAVDHGADIVHISLGAPAVTGVGGTDIIPECGDGVDNDGDGQTDADDVGCTDGADGSEGPVPGSGIPESAAACADGRDNDGDEVTDFPADGNCSDADDNFETPASILERPAEPAECSDGIDNDGDGRTDGDGVAGGPGDPGCESEEDGSEGPFPEDAGSIPENAPACSDGRDNNDSDNAADITADPECDNALDNNEGQGASSQEVDPLREVIDYALEQGVVVVAAAGNDATEGDPVYYPAAYPGVITVGATDRQRERAFYSSTGRWLDIAAPGGGSTGTVGGDVSALWELDRVKPVAGTSFAAPLVTGTASLYLGLNPHITRGFTPSIVPPDPAANLPDVGYQRTVDDIRIAIQDGARQHGTPGHDIFTGWGHLDTNRTLDVEALGGPVMDPARAQLPRTNADSVVEAAEGLALSRAAIFPPFVVLTRSDVAVDALAAAPLTAEAPLLLASPDEVSNSTLAAMDQLMPHGGRVYVLGGEAALSSDVTDQITAAGHEVVRLAGASRVDTAIAIADEVRRLYPGSSTVGVLRADGGSNPTAQWADALSAGAWAARHRVPLVVTSTSRLSPEVGEALARWETTDTIVFGGVGAISSTAEAALPSPTRIAGASRADTAAEIATTLWGDTDGYLIANGYFARGWAPALAAAGLAAETNRPLLFSAGASVPEATIDVLNTTCPDAEDIQIIGGASLVSGSAESSITEAIQC